MIKIETNAGRTTTEIHGTASDVVSDAALIVHRLYTSLLRNDRFAAKFFETAVRDANNAFDIWTDDTDSTPG